MINGYFAALTAQTTDKEIGLIGGLFGFVCGLVYYPPNGDILSSVGDNSGKLCPLQQGKGIWVGARCCVVACLAGWFGVCCFCEKFLQ